MQRIDITVDRFRTTCKEIYRFCTSDWGSGSQMEDLADLADWHSWHLIDTLASPIYIFK